MSNISFAAACAGYLLFIVPHPASAQAADPASINRRVDALLQQMTLEEKIGEMTQLTIQAVARSRGTAVSPMQLDSAKLEEALVRRHVGALLNVYDVALSPEQWRDLITTIQRFAQRKRLKIPVLYGIDAVHGHHYQTTSTLFPQNIALAATWNPSLVRRANEITAYETRASGITWNFSPVLDIGRQPLWPRFYETFGEDPHLVSVLGVQAVLGNQIDPRPALRALIAGEPNPVGTARSANAAVFVAATGKHFLGYSLPLSGKDRTTAWIPDRELRELVLPPFRAAIENGLRTVMINSGDVNGVPVHSSKEILTTLLRTELGFTGIADSDWEDIVRLHTVHRVAATNKDAVRMAVMAGIDMSMVPYDFSFTDDLLALVREGAVTRARIDEAVRRILRVKFELGLFENALPDAGMAANTGAAAFQAVSRAAAEQAVTLLKNERGLLPLSKRTRVLVTGPTANSLRSQFGGWSYTWQGTDTAMYPKGVKTLLDAVRDEVGESQVTFVPGATLTEERDVPAAVAAAKAADVAIVALGEDAYAETPGNIDDLTIPAAQIRLARAIEASGTPVIIVLFHGRPRIVREVVDSARAIVTGYETGPYGGEAVARVLFGDVNPSGRLPFTWPRATGAILIPYDRARPADIGGTDTTMSAYTPEWPFGHGLSYTAFAYSDLNVATPTVRGGDSVRVAVTITNTGPRAGFEVVQLYVRERFASVNPPVRRLQAFNKVELAPGASRPVTFAIATEQLSFVGRDGRRTLEPGSFDIMIGRLQGQFALTAR
ncbi:MAG: glycoside hydrolase family 3 N-terminal domain-containing protein [Gemmatimonadaceae bacterium]